MVNKKYLNTMEGIIKKFKRIQKGGNKNMTTIKESAEGYTPKQTRNISELQKISVDVDLLRRGIGKCLKYADSLNAEKAVIVGPKELEKESITIRDLKTGKQETIKLVKVIDYFK